MGKRGEIWISAALYIGIGIVLVTLILSVGIPLVNKIQTRNTVLQTKDVMFKFDKLIRDVYLEGLGSRRPFFIDIKEGEFLIDKNDNNWMEWIIEAEDNLGVEPDLDLPIKEGNLNMKAETVGEGFRIHVWLDFSELVDIESDLESLTGKYNLVVEHKQFTEGSKNGQRFVEIREV